MTAARNLDEKGAPTMPPSSAATASSVPATPPEPPAPLDTSAAAVASSLAQQLLECQAFSTAWLIKAGQLLAEHQRQAGHGDMTAIHQSRLLPWGRRYCQVLALLGRNPALADPKMLAMLPSSIAALEVIAANLDARLIQEGLRSGALHRRLTREGARAAVRRLRTQALLKNPTDALP